MRKYIMVASLFPSALAAIVLAILIMRVIHSYVGLPDAYLTVTFAILCSVLMGVLMGTCFGLLGLRLIRRDGQILIVDTKDPRFEQFISEVTGRASSREQERRSL